MTGRPVNFIGNAGDAEVVGLEAQLSARPNDRLTVGLTFGYADSELTSALADAVVGADLPNVPEFTMSASLEYVFPFGGLGDGFARLDVQHTDDQFTRIQRINDPTGFPVDSYVIGQFRIGFRNERGWGADLFVDSLWDERATIGRGRTATGSFNSPDRFVINRPRTIGVVLRVET